MVARIDHERAEREALEQQRQELLKRKQKLIADNKRRKDDLANLDNDLEKFIDVSITGFSHQGCALCRLESNLLPGRQTDPETFRQGTLGVASQTSKRTDTVEGAGFDPAAVKGSLQTADAPNPPSVKSWYKKGAYSSRTGAEDHELNKSRQGLWIGARRLGEDRFGTPRDIRYPSRLSKYPGIRHNLLDHQYCPSPAHRCFLKSTPNQQ